ncbi:MAG TPA: hypothetical protein PKV71_13070 [Calditrichia bacterium]|nr:hypothetical protein [Calditrichia bacterium]HQV32809.1 hypothetical protein [Calditrichia bacterium]
MNVRNKFRELVKYRAGALCLIGILSATFMHSTTFMSQFFYNSLILGAIAAFAVDAGVVAMSIFKDELIKDGELAWMVRVVTSLVLFASGVANMSEGFKSAYGIQLTYPNLMSLDILTWTQWLAGTVIFPILAYVMCDTIGTRNLVEFRQSQKSGDGRQELVQKYIPIDQKAATSLRAANRKKQLKRADRIRMLEEYIDDNPNASLAEMADYVGVESRETVRRYLTEINQQPNGYAKPASKFGRN